MNTQPSDTRTKQGPAKIIAASVAVVLLVAGGTFFMLGKKPATQIATPAPEKSFNSFVIVTGPTLDDTVTLKLKRPSGQEIEIPENVTLDATQRVFSHGVDEGHDYTLTTDIRDKNDHVRTLAMTLSNDPMMIVINVSGFTPDDGLDLFVGRNSISSRTWLDWAGNLEQIIPLPLEPKGPFCLVITDAAKIETVRVCHELPIREDGGILG